MNRAGFHRKRYLNLAFVLVVLLVALPLVDGRRTFESIIVTYNHSSSGVILSANLTYSTDEWYFDIQKEVIFSLSYEIPDNITLRYNVSKSVVYLDFEEEDYVYTLVNNTEQIQGEVSSAGFILDTTIALLPLASNVSSVSSFQMDSSNAAVLGFLITVDLIIDDGQGSVTVDNVNIFNHNPDEYAWNQPSGLDIASTNDDLIFIRSFNTYLVVLFNNISPYILFGMFVFLFWICCRNSERYREYKASKPRAYINESSEVYGREYKHGIRVILAYYMCLIYPDQSDRFREIVSMWAKREANLILPLSLETSSLPSEEEPIWNDLKKQLAISALRIDYYLYERFPRGKRSLELIQLLRKNRIPVTNDVEEWIIANIDREIEDEIKRISPSGELFANLRYFVEDQLRTLIPNTLKELIDAVEKLEKEVTSVVFGAVALSCRAVIEDILYILVTEEILPENVSKPDKSKTRDNMSLLKNWLKDTLKNQAETPIARIESGFDYFFYFTVEYGKMIQRAVHKEKIDLQKEEIWGLVVGLYGWMNDLLILVERANQM